MQRFKREAEATSRLDHPNLVKIHDFGIAGGSPYLVMDYIQGTTLADAIKADTRLTPEIVVHIMSQACEAFEHAHSCGIIHRDIKPSNIMVEHNGNKPNFVRVVDFGIAKLVAEDPEIHKLTKTGEVFGTPLYMSPEQCQGLTLDARTDIYSLGCVMYEALSGNAPFTGSSIYDILFKQINEIPEGLAASIPERQTREAMETVVFAAMAKDPSKRYATMAKLKEDLDHIEQGRNKGLVANLARQWNLQQLKRSPLERRIPFRFVVACCLVLLSVAVACSLFVYRAMLPEQGDYYQTALWKGGLIESRYEPVLENGDIQQIIQGHVARILMHRKQSSNTDSATAVNGGQPQLGLSDIIDISLGGSGVQHRDPEIIANSRKMGTDLYKHQYYELAALSYEDAVNGEMLRGPEAKALPSLEGTFNRLAKIYASQKRWWQLDQVYGKWIPLWSMKTAAQRDPQKESLINCRYAEICRQICDLPDINSVIRASFRQRAKEHYMEAQKNNMVATTGLACIGLARLFEQEGKTSEAEREYAQADKTLEQALAANPSGLRVFLGNYGDFLWKKGQYLEALKLKLRAAMLTEPLDKPGKGGG